MLLRVTAAVLISTCLATLPAYAQDAALADDIARDAETPRDDAASTPTEAEETVATADNVEVVPLDAGPDLGVLPIGAAIVPGFLLHGSGAWAAGERSTAKRLLLAEGIGAGALLSSIVALAVTGASRRFTGVLVPTAVSGAFLFLGSWLADIYGVSVPFDKRGSAPLHLPRLEVSMLASYRYDPRAATDVILMPTAKVTLGRWTLNANGQIAPSNSSSRIRGDVRYRVFKRNADFVDFQVAVTNNSLGEDDVNALSFEFAVPARLDLAHLGRILKGGFAELSLGGMMTSVRYSRVDEGDTDGTVLARGAIGAYLGDGNGEVSIFYDHRRDTFAGGAILGGVSAGFAGYAGIHGSYYFSRNLGATAVVELGSALIAGAGLTMRFGEGN